jgi:D-alanyl-D-alanine carboxypeptidase
MPGLRLAFESIGSFLEQRLPLMHSPGAALAVTDAHEILGVVVRGFADAEAGSPVRPETRFEIGSISKSFAALVALQEVEAGRLDLDRPVSDYVPWVKLREPFGPITLHHLLSHTSGLPLGTEDSGEEVFAVWSLRHIDPGFAPGERFHYSNDGYTLVGAVLEELSGRLMPDLLRERIFEPLGMTNTVAEITVEERVSTATGYQTLYDDRPARREHPLVPAPWITSRSAAGSIISDVVDMSAYVRMLLDRGRGPHGRIVGEDSFALMIAPVREDPEDPGVSYGYGLRTNQDAGRTYLGHSGGMVGYTALILLDSEAGLGATMLLNGSGERTSIVRFALRSARAALEDGVLPQVGDAPDPTRIRNAGEYAGRYVGPERTIELVAEGDALRLRDGDADVVLELDPNQEPEDAFLVPEVRRDRFYLRFARGEDGRVIEALHGPDRFVREDSGRSVIPRPLAEEWRPFPGHYRSYNPWNPSIRIVARDGALWMIAPWEVTDLQLVPLEDGVFRVGAEEWRPDRIRFDVLVKGEAFRATFSGAPMYRSGLP